MRGEGDSFVHGRPLLWDKIGLAQKDGNKLDVNFVPTILAMVGAFFMGLLKPDDVRQIVESGRDMNRVVAQTEAILQGKQYLDLVEPATVENHRIKRIEPAEFEELTAVWKEMIEPGVVKFVPASGAASRMFKALNFVNNSDLVTVADVDGRVAELERKTELEAAEQDELSSLKGFQTFWKLLDTFPFYNELKSTMVEKGANLESDVASGQITNTLRYLLTKDGLNYAGWPKLFLSFHLDGGEPRIAMEEHIKEAIQLSNGKLHFTVSPDHLSKAAELADYFVKEYGKRGQEIQISLSIQEPVTDTVALGLDGKDFHRLPDGSLLFRQSGHGALSMNLEMMPNSFIVVQNVDNLPGGNAEILQWKRAFMGYFGKMLRRVYALAENLKGAIDAGEVDAGLVNEAFRFVFRTLKAPMDVKVYEPASVLDKARMIFDMINRPLVVAGVVPNTGEPGGGPFAVRDPNTGLVSNQIVEGAQQNKAEPAQAKIAGRATHFNPVFLIMSTHDAWGNKYDMTAYAKRSGGNVFYVEKSDAAGRPYASIDTGLWNGEVAGMLMLFCEMPLDTFGPAKTVLDLTPKERVFRVNPYPAVVEGVPFVDVLQKLREPSKPLATVASGVEILSNLPKGGIDAGVVEAQITKQLGTLERVNETFRTFARRTTK